MNTHNENQPTWQNSHSFGQDRKKPGEARTFIVVLLTAVTMVVEIVAGITYGSMALLADGLHMASHATALVISLFAYIYARRNAYDHRFCFGTGKVNSLAGFTGAILLAMFALVMLWESGHGFLNRCLSRLTKRWSSPSWGYWSTVYLLPYLVAALRIRTMSTMMTINTIITCGLPTFMYWLML